MTLDQIVESLKSKFGPLLGEPAAGLGETTLRLTDPSQVAVFSRVLKHDHHFEMLVDICGIDNLGEDPRFEIVYHAYSFKIHQYLRFKTAVRESKPVLPSVCGIWAAANWHEREAYDMLGIRFEGHPDLRRILMWEGYPYFPLRKDFPLAGRHTEDTWPAPMDGGPFVTRPGDGTTVEREPRGKGETFRKFK